MFNRLARIICTSRRPLKLSKQSSIIPASINRGLLLSNRLCSSVGVKPPVNETEDDDDNNNELKIAIEADPTLEKRYKILQLEVDVLRHTGKLVPERLKPHHWVQLLKADSRAARKKYLDFLFINEKKRENALKKKELARIKRAELQEAGVNGESADPDSNYRLHKNSMFMRIYDTTMNQFYHTRLIQSMMFGPKLILDCGYYDKMTSRECSETAKQLAYLFGQNRLHPDPFDLHFCNVNKSSQLMQNFNRIIRTAYEPDFPLNITEKSYTDIFHKNNLVYLTPDCNNELKEYDPHSVYIIGAIVDKSNKDPLSLAKAKKEGLRMAKLPLDKYLLWGSGSGKRLALNQIVSILTDLRITGDWHIALKHVPTRKLERRIEDLRSDVLPGERNTSYNNRFGKDDVLPGERNTSYNNRFGKNDVLPGERNTSYNNRFGKDDEQKVKNSFTFRDRAKRSFNK